MKKYVAEFIGTAVLVFFGCGSAVAANTMFSAMGMLPVAFTTLLIAIAFGMALTVVVYAFGDISGAHVNPAVSLGMLITKRMTVKDFAGYVAAQILGAVAGALILSFIIGSKMSLGANGYGEASTFGSSMLVALVLEIILTFVFVYVVMEVTSKVENKGIAGVVIGIALTLVHILGIPFTGTSVNPARSFGPALVQAFEGTEAIAQVWVFIVGPLAGAALAAGLYMFFKKGEEDGDEDEEDVIDIPLEALTDEEKEEIKAIAEAEGVKVNMDTDACENEECDCDCDDSACDFDDSACDCDDSACDCDDSAEEVVITVEEKNI